MRNGPNQRTRPPSCICSRRLSRRELRMNRDHGSNHCDICDAPISSDLPVCSECEKAFESAPEAQPVREATTLDLERYSCRMCSMLSDTALAIRSGFGSSLHCPDIVDQNAYSGPAHKRGCSGMMGLHLSEVSPLLL